MSAKGRRELHMRVREHFDTGEEPPLLELADSLSPDGESIVLTWEEWRDYRKVCRAFYEWQERLAWLRHLRLQELAAEQRERDRVYAELPARAAAEAAAAAPVVEMLRAHFADRPEYVPPRSVDAG